jgi:ubiquinone/menaquinone biosynthesis C-methylase UbiE
MPSVIPFAVKPPVAYLDKVSALEPVKAYKKSTFEMLKPQPGECLLDVGCGTGDDVLALARMVPRAGRVVGIDRDLNMIAEAWRRAAEESLPVEFKVGDVHKLEFPDGSFSACRSDRVFQHLESPEQALAEIVRTLKPGGRVVISDPDWATLVVDAAAPKTTRKIVQFICEVQIRNSDMGRRLRSLFRLTGLKDIRVSAGTIMIIDLRLANQVWSLEKNAADARAASVISESECNDWLHAISAAAENDNFLGACTGFMACGVKKE